MARAGGRRGGKAPEPLPPPPPPPPCPRRLRRLRLRQLRRQARPWSSWAWWLVTAGGRRRLEEGERRRLKKKKAAAGVQWVPGTRFSFHYARQGHGKGVGGVGAKKPPTAKTTAETPDVLNPTPYGNSKLPFAPPAEGERGFGFLSSSRSEMGERTSPPVSPNQERPWEEEGREDTWMPRSNHLVVHLPTIYIIIYMLCCWGLPASAPLSVSSRLVSHKHTQTHTTPQIHHPSYSFFFFTA